MKRPTQVDVAKIAGVSRATVSLVVNGQGNGKVPISEETRARVMKAVDELGYEPDVRAQALRSGDTKTIGLILIDMYNPHYWEHAEGIEREARSQGYNVLLFTRSLDHEYISRIFKDLSGKRIDGLILSGGIFQASNDARSALDRIHKYRLPVVELCDVKPEYDIDCIVSDYREATKEVVAYLITLGHERIAMIDGVAQPLLAADRLEPYRAGLAAGGLRFDEALLVHCGPTIEDGYQAALQLLRHPVRPTAIIAINDLLAIGVLRAAADCGLRVPQDLSLVSYDDIAFAKYMTPRLTTASKKVVDGGRDAVRLVIGRIQNPEIPYQVLYKPAKLIIRESTGPAPT